MVSEDNPAGRLYLAVSRAQELKGDGGRPMGHIWAEIFGISPDAVGDLYEAHAALIEQAQEAQRLIRESDDIADNLHLLPFQITENALANTAPRDSWNHFGQQLQPDTIRSLAYTSAELSRISRDIVIDGEQLTGLLVETRQLIDSVIAASIHDKLKLFLLEKLRAIEKALIDYRIRGSTEVRRVVEFVIGGIQLFAIDIETDVLDDSSDIVGEFRALLTHLGKAVAVGTALAKLISQRVLPILPP